MSSHEVGSGKGGATKEIDETRIPQEEEETVIVYRVWTNPHLTWFEIILEFVVSFLLPFRRITTLARKHTNDRHENVLATNNKIRQTIATLESSTVARKILSTKVFQAPIVDLTWKIPRNENVLKEWGVYDETCFHDDKPLEQQLNPKTNIAVQTFFPVSFLSTLTDAVPDKNGYVLLESNELPNELLLNTDDNVAWIVFFHGGGMTIGDAYGNFMLLQDCLTQTVIDQKVVLFSVDYALAPEQPFPVAVSETLTVLDHLLQNTRKNIHLLGVSAGGNLATVATLEGHRRYPGRITSALLTAPMLNPACDSISCCQNSQSSWLLPLEWLAWCWRVYLRLDQTEANDDDSPEHAMSLSNNNRTAWNASRFKNTVMERLIHPALFVPKNITTRFIVTTNKADLLHDDGVELVEALRSNNNNVRHFDHSGPHVTGTFANSSACSQVAQAFRESLLSSETTNG